MKRLKIGIVGAGAVGCTFAAMLAKAGFNVELATVRKKQMNLASNVAIDVSGEFGNHTVLVNVCQGIEKFSSLKDFIFICARAIDVKKHATLAYKYLTPNGKIVALQNVLTIDDIFQVVPKNMVIGLIMGWCVTRNTINSVTVQTKGINVIGSYYPNMEKSLILLKRILSNVTDTYISNNIMGLAVSRVIINSAISALGCITGARLGNLMNIKNVKHLFEEIFREDMRVTNALGIKIVPYCREFDYYELMKPGLITFMQRRRKLNQLGTQNPYVVSSILRCIEQNKPTEINYTLGYFVKEGRRLNIKTPINLRLMEMIDDIENHEIGIFPDNAMDYYLRKPYKYDKKELNINYVNR